MYSRTIYAQIAALRGGNAAGWAARGVFAEDDLPLAGPAWIAAVS